MFGLLAVPVMQAMVGSIAAIEKETKLRNDRLVLMRETLSPEDFEKWEAKETEERRHREVCEAIRATKPDPVQPKDDSMSLFKVILGAGIIGSMIDD
jgi:hypothetical protein